MEFSELVEIVGEEPVFETGLLLSGNVNPAEIRRQLSRWTKTGKVYQIRRGLYALAPPYQKVKPHPFTIANHLLQASYVSLQSALAYYAMIPEYVPITTSVTTGRPHRWENPLGNYDFQRIQINLFYGYQPITLDNKQLAFIASPEKALLDLIYLEPGGDAMNYLRGLRLENLEHLDWDELRQLAERSGKPKLSRAIHHLVNLAGEFGELETL